MVTDYYTDIVFFEPTQDFLEWLYAKFHRATFIDCGCGKGHLTRALNNLGLQGIGIDIFPHPEAVSNMLRGDATRFKMAEDMLPIIARPSRGRWVRATIRNAVEQTGQLLYIGLEKHYEEDLSCLPYSVTEVFPNAGLEAEKAWLITKEKNKMAKRTFDKVVLIYSIQVNRSVLVGLKGRNKYWNCGQSYCDFDPSLDKVLKEFPNYQSDADLDAIELEVYQSLCPEPQTPEARLGWVSPEGAYYPCSYCAHEYLAKLLVAKHYNRLAGSGLLENSGWCKINAGFFYVEQDSPGNSALLDTLGKIVAAFVAADNIGTNFNNTLRANPEEYYESDAWSTPTDSKDIVSQFQQSYRFLSGEEQYTELVVPTELQDPISRRAGYSEGD